jgi:hypothetical protein
LVKFRIGKSSEDIRNAVLDSGVVLQGLGPKVGRKLSIANFQLAVLLQEIEPQIFAERIYRLLRVPDVRINGDAPGGIFNSSKALSRLEREIALKKFEPAITASKGQYA